MKLLLPIEIHVAVCELQETHRPTVAGLLLQSCVIQVPLLRGVWNSGAAPEASSAVQQLVLENIIFKITNNNSVVEVVVSESVVVLN